MGVNAAAAKPPGAARSALHSAEQPAPHARDGELRLNSMASSADGDVARRHVKYKRQKRCDQCGQTTSEDDRYFLPEVRVNLKWRVLEK